MKIIKGLAFAGLMLLAACQSATNESAEAPVTPVAGSARIIAAAVAADQVHEGNIDRYEVVVAFRSMNGVGARFTRSRMCHVVEGCLNRDIDFTVPPTGVVAFRVGFGSGYTLDADGYTATYTGLDARGNPVQTSYTFSSAMLARLPSAQR